MDHNRDQVRTARSEGIRSGPLDLMGTRSEPLDLTGLRSGPRKGGPAKVGEVRTVGSIVRGGLDRQIQTREGLGA